MLHPFELDTACVRPRSAPLRSVLALLPPGPPDAMVDRIAGLRLAAAAEISLVRVCSGGSQPRDDAHAHLVKALGYARGRLATQSITGTLSTRPVRTEIEEEGRAMRSELVVVPRSAAGTSSLIETLARPILVTSATVAPPYRRPLIAVDADAEDARKLVAMALRVLAIPRPRLAFISGGDGRDTVQHRVVTELRLALVVMSMGPYQDVEWSCFVPDGRVDLRRAVAALDRDLLVIGQRRAAELGDLSCDALVVP